MERNLALDSMFSSLFLNFIMNSPGDTTGENHVEKKKMLDYISV